MKVVKGFFVYPLKTQKDLPDKIEQVNTSKLYYTYLLNPFSFNIIEKTLLSLYIS